MHQKTIKQLSSELTLKKISSVELTKEFLKRVRLYDSKINSFITIDEERALAEAKEADVLIKKGANTFLTGIPIAHKDIFCTKGIKTSCGSKMLDNFISPYDATIVKRLKEAGAVCIGKTNMDEFAMGSSNETSFYGPVHNPWNIENVPGGSSGGSAAAIAARLVCGATGSDTGGSIRQPAAFCGVTGIKPTYGRVSRYGMIAFASSLDQGGTLTQTVEDSALMLETISGFDKKDSTSLMAPVPNFSKEINTSWDKIRIGIPNNFFDSGLDSESSNLVMEAIKIIEKLGAKIINLDLKHIDLSVPSYYVVAPAEASSNLSRFDGVRYGYREKNTQNLNELYKLSRSKGFGDEVKRRIIIGTYVLSAGYYDAYYLQAQKVRKLISQSFVNAFKEVDIIIGPTTPTPAFKIGQKMDDPIQMYLNDIYTIGANLAGLPALSIPCGFSSGLPIGMQLIGPYLKEDLILKIGHHFQKETNWHTHLPAEFL
ncbi:MAG: aspartyl/glutamyl-tRNA amidotransferase subunit A [Gammaproteobacteria bacterium TMED78]|nr:MAG: aspartyl/glutamyl-tRNA amidotransferase subunit A [Gammaproteobacteria bacterium TMED78]|tara:strand:- start:11156 stop:12610 length:1455 start_codon:yes stop_codon:yes gene_type:complete